MLKHIPAASDRGEPTYVYAMFRTKEGGFGFDVMSMDAVRTFAQQYSKSFSSGPWQRNFEEMAKKTVLKKVLKYAPLKSDFQRGLALDGTIKADVGEICMPSPARCWRWTARQAKSQRLGRKHDSEKNFQRDNACPQQLLHYT